ncbi:hypothetical protein K469DRAFT_711815 [Zopfia rhizophila CBS 207.26]|uniref:Uncharacterized protein n=1 Tax=Zopfia rhizophila CBS 207.26 TaxID=1314779 RepID=A0A6A6DSU1_9PEZI|nr:hypothetical protein K469DRAFT_711815 [Zopfia rhizophila CBS 207.26]
MLLQKLAERENAMKGLITKRFRRPLDRQELTGSESEVLPSMRVSMLLDDLEKWKIDMVQANYIIWGRKH